MPLPSASATTELAAVNQILGAIGQAPVTTLDQLNPDVAIAYDTLLEINREVQSEGWSFNTEREYPFTPDNNNQIVIPSNVLQLDLSNNFQNKGYSAVRRDGKLYNKTEHIYTWTDFSPVLCDVVWLFSFTDLPQPFRDHIVAKAALAVATKMTASTELYQLLIQRASDTRVSVIEYECNQGDYSFFGWREDNNYYSSYQPFYTLAR